MYRENLVNICSGLQAPGDVENDLMVARDKGSNELEIFLGKRIRTNEISFFAPI